MAYDKPGVEITQVQQTVSPNLTAPDLGAAIIAPAYVVVPMEGQGSYTYAQTFTGSGQTINLSGLNSLLYVDPYSVYCDLVKTTGTTTGRIHVENVALFPATPYGLTASNGSTAGTGSFTWNAATASLYPTWSGAQIRVHYRALNLGVAGFYSLQAESDINSIFGNGQGGYYNNPLPFALTLALQNSTTQIAGVPIYVDAIAQYPVLASGTETTEHLRAQTLLESQEVYGIAPYTQNAALFTSYTNWVESLSQPINKHERVVFVAPEVTWYDASGNVVANYLTADRATTARFIRDNAAVVLDRRTFYVRPHVAYYSFSSLPVQELRPLYLQSVNGIADPVYALLSSSVNITNPDNSITFYPALTPVTDSVMSTLLNSTNQYQFSAYLPLPGTMMVPEIVGMVAGQNPEQGFTNLPMSGPSMLKFSNDYFSEAQLNTMAAGGNYIIINVAGSFVARHQLSTDMNSVEERELSITKSIDFVAKFVRNVLAGFIGRTLITPSFLGVVSAILNGLGSRLIKDGHINGFKVISVTQDPVNPDTINVALEVLPKYPVNYIKVNLIF